MKSKSKLLFRALTAFFITIMAVSAWKIWEISSEYRKGENSYEEISRMVSILPKAVTPQPSAAAEPAETAVPTAAEPAETAVPTAAEPAETAVPAEEDTTIWPEVDFAALREVNPDIVAWIYIEGTEISYPVVQGEDNSYYLKHLFTGEWNGAGCVFLDFQNDAGFADRHSILYGHHMKNDTMFSTLDKYKQQDFVDQHPFGLLMTPDRNYKIEFFSGYVTAPQDDAWDIGFTESEFEVWLQNTVDRSCFTSEVIPDITDHILTLSTCSYEFDDARFVLVGVLH